MFITFSANAEKVILLLPAGNNVHTTITSKDSLSENLHHLHNKPVKFKRLKAFLLTIALGNFGGHRLYLGTSPKVVVAYSFTLGGVFILPIIDAIMILTTKDLSKFENNDNFFMFSP